MLSAGRLNVKGTDIKGCSFGMDIAASSGMVRASVDHCHLDGNLDGYVADTTAPGGSLTTATYTTANNNGDAGWICGLATSGKDVLILEFCTASESGNDGLIGESGNALSVVRYSNCVFSNNGGSGVHRDSGIVETRGNNTITGNSGGDTLGAIGTFLPK